MINDKEIGAATFRIASKEYKNTRLKYTVIIAGLLMIFGAMLFIRGWTQGIFMATLGLIIFGVAAVLRGRMIMRRARELESYYSTHGEFPHEGS